MKSILFALLVVFYCGFVSAQGETPLWCGTVNMNTTADQPLNIAYSSVVVRRATMTQASISLTTAAGGVYTAAAKGGAQVVPSTQVYSTLNTAAKFLDLTLQAPATTTTLNGQTVFLSLTTAQGAPATARLCIYGDIIN